MIDLLKQKFRDLSETGKSLINQGSTGIAFKLSYAKDSLCYSKNSSFTFCKIEL